MICTEDWLVRPDDRNCPKDGRYVFIGGFLGLVSVDEPASRIMGIAREQEELMEVTKSVSSNSPEEI